MSKKRLHKIIFDYSDFAKMLPFPDICDNKYTRGKLEVVAGNKKYPGAAILCSRAANVSGCGYVRLFTDNSSVLNIATNNPDVVVSSFCDLDKKLLFNNNRKYKIAYVIGPGFDSSVDSNKQIIYRILKYSKNPVLIDGGALGYLCAKKFIKILKKRSKSGYKTVLTPHMGEAKRLLHCNKSKKQQQLSNLEIAKSICDIYNSIVVLKGPKTYIANNKNYYVFDKGTEALSKAGTGDVLAGIIGSLISTEKLSVFNSCCLGVNIHALAAKIAIKDSTTISLTPSNLVNKIPLAIKKLAKCD